MLHLGPVIVCDAWRNGRVGHQCVDACRFEDVRGILFQRLVVADHAVVYFAWRTQLCVRHPVDDVLAKLPVHTPVAFHIAEVANKVFEVETGGDEVIVAVNLAIFPYNGRSYVVLVPRLEAGVLHKLVLECRDQALEGIPHNEEFEIGV